MKLQFKFIQVNMIAPDVQVEIEKLDKLAYLDAEREENWPSKWSTPTWMVLGYLQNQLVSQLGLLKREIIVGKKNVEVVGIGGVATHPEWQRKGFAKQLMAFTETIMRNEIHCDFALLLCDGMPCSIYRNAGWKDIAEYIVYHENNVRYSLNTNVMVFEISEIPFPEGEIDVCGLPW